MLLIKVTLKRISREYKQIDSSTKTWEYHFTNHLNLFFA